MQFGAELVGAGDVDADAEILHLAWEGLHRLGVDARLTVGHMGVLYRLLGAFELSDRAKGFIVSNIGGLRDGGIGLETVVQRAGEAGILEQSGDRHEGLSPQPLVEGIGVKAAGEFVESVLSESMPSPLGRRTSGQIVSRLVRKLSETDSPSVFDEGLSFVGELVRLEGPPEQVLGRARSVAADRGAPVGELDALAGIVQTCIGKGVPEGMITLDLGLARGLSYYTGVVFTLSHSSGEGVVLLGSGGRYDGLVRALGGSEDVPALGYAYNLEDVIALQSRSEVEADS